MSARRRRRHRRQKRFEQESRPISLHTKVICGISAVSILLCVCSVTLMSRISLDVLVRIMAGLGFGLMIVGAATFYMAVKNRRDKSDPMYAKVAAIVMSFAALFVWGSLYVMGLIHE